MPNSTSNTKPKPLTWLGSTIGGLVEGAAKKKEDAKPQRNLGYTREVKKDGIGKRVEVDDGTEPRDLDQMRDEKKRILRENAAKKDAEGSKVGSHDGASD